jgi:hypothetical protein
MLRFIFIFLKLKNTIFKNKIKGRDHWSSGAKNTFSAIHALLVGL